MLAKNPATRCFWIEINSHIDPSLDSLPDFAQARADDPLLRLPYTSLQRIAFANRLDCARQYSRDEVLKAIARIKVIAATPSGAPTEAWATLHGYAEQEILRLAHSKNISAPSTERPYHSTLREVIRRCAERLSTRPSTAFVTQLVHHNSPFVASHQLLDLETSDGLSNFFAGIRPQIEHFDSNASQLWWKQLLRDFAAPSDTGVSKLSVLLAHELNARRLTVGRLYKKMIEMHTANPQAALLMFDLDALTSPRT
jgi:hypothetical protein